MVVALASGGCSTQRTILGQGQEPASKPPVQSEATVVQLALARDLILTGKDDAARDLLQKITSERSVPGVTDEALFRHGLLTLKYENEANGYPQTRQVLERLIHDYPGSVWAVQAIPLNDLLVGRWMSEVSLGKTRRLVKALKDSNLSLTRENKEMRLNIEKLKTLEQELELKSRR
jgi:hypothetical protein